MRERRRALSRYERAAAGEAVARIACAVPEFERAVKLDEGVLRFLIVTNEGPQPVPPSADKGDGEDDE